MSPPTGDDRAKGWNIELFIRNSSIAGIYQHADFLSIGDVARDLDLCLVFESPSDDDGDWQPALLPRDVATSADETLSHPLILLDKTNAQPFPGPESGTAQYTYLFHSAGLCAHPGEPHAEDNPCCHQAQRPERRYDQRYLAIGKQLTYGGRCITAPLRSSKRKRPSDTSTTVSRAGVNSRDTSPSSTTSESEVTEIAEVPLSLISKEMARPIVNKFRHNVLGGTNGCAISGKGKSWLVGVPGIGIEAAHIIPQLQWAVYPLDEGIARPENQRSMELAWRRTWTASNGIPLLSHLHKCFDARLVSIHPQTKRVRAFVSYDILTDHHGREALLPSRVDVKTLQHHYDMCCIENMVAPWILSAPDPLEYRRGAQLAFSSVADRQRPTTVPGQPAAFPMLPPAVPPTTSGPTSLAPSNHTTTHPPSPPRSDAGRKRMWLCGAEVITDPQQAEGLMRQGWILRDAPDGLRDTSHEKPAKPDRVKKWLCGSQEITDAQEAKDLMSQGWILYEVEDGDEDEDEDVAKRAQKAEFVRTWLHGTDAADGAQDNHGATLKPDLLTDSLRGRPPKRKRCTAADEDDSGLAKKQQL